MRSSRDRRVRLQSMTCPRGTVPGRGASLPDGPKTAVAWRQADRPASRPSPWQGSSGKRAEAEVTTPAAAVVGGRGGGSSPSGSVATPGEFAAPSANLRWYERIVLRSMPVTRSISRWLAPASSRVRRVVCRCGFKTFTPHDSLGGRRGRKVTSCMGSARRRAWRPQLVIATSPGWGNLGWPSVGEFGWPPGLSVAPSGHKNGR